MCVAVCFRFVAEYNKGETGRLSKKVRKTWQERFVFIFHPTTRMPLMTLMPFMIMMSSFSDEEL